jgi:hypothetical protein
MALSEDQADTVVQTSIREAGGFKGPHHGNTKLDTAGLKLSDQRKQFRRRVAANSKQKFNHRIAQNAVPNSPDTTVSQARTAVRENATPIDGDA